MKEFWTASSYGEAKADVYDEWIATTHPLHGAVERLKLLADGGSVLELGLGTGRLAIPLQVAGVDITGIEASQAMLKQLRQDPVGRQIPVVEGDFAQLETLGLQRLFRLIFISLETLPLLADGEKQLQCIQGVANHLEPGGFFAVDLGMPNPARFTRDQATVASIVNHDRSVLELSHHDPLKQTIQTQFVFLRGGENVDLRPQVSRYIWPAELDLMARIANLELHQRSQDWHGTPLANGATRYISIYRRPLK